MVERKRVTGQRRIVVSLKVSPSKLQPIKKIKPVLEMDDTYELQKTRIFES
jgi:hypothetical protein